MPGDLRMLDSPSGCDSKPSTASPNELRTRLSSKSKGEYAKGNIWPNMPFTEDAELNQQAMEWRGRVPTRWIQVTTCRVPQLKLVEERPHLGGLPSLNNIGLIILRTVP